MPGGVALADRTQQVTLVRSSGSIAIAVLLGLAAIVLGRRAREFVQVTLGRAAGLRTAAAGRLLGVVGVLVGLTAAIALGFYGLLTLFAE